MSPCVFCQESVQHCCFGFIEQKSLFTSILFPSFCVKCLFWGRDCFVHVSFWETIFVFWWGKLFFILQYLLDQTVGIIRELFPRFFRESFWGCRQSWYFDLFHFVRFVFIPLFVPSFLCLSPSFCRLFSTGITHSCLSPGQHFESTGVIATDPFCFFCNSNFLCCYFFSSNLFGASIEVVQDLNEIRILMGTGLSRLVFVTLEYASWIWIWRRASLKCVTLMSPESMLTKTASCVSQSAFPETEGVFYLFILFFAKLHFMKQKVKLFVR